MENIPLETKTDQSNSFEVNRICKLKGNGVLIGTYIFIVVPSLIYTIIV
jgi:hypothetical protein